MTRSCLFLLSLMFTLTCNQPGKDKKSSNDDSRLITELTEKNACVLSQITYCNDVHTALAKYLTGWKLLWEGTELEGNFAFVASNGKEYVLAIRGSLIDFNWSAFQNWIYQDLHVVSQQRWPYTLDPSNAKISQGAYDGWQHLCKMKDKETGRLLLPFLETVLNEDSRLLITGHSLGGNLAAVYASFLRQKIKNKGPDINVISFGAPAAGNQAFAEDYNKKFPSSIRVENINDIVPKFPSTSGIDKLGGLFNDSVSAGNIQVGYKDITVSLSTVFTLLKTTVSLLEFTNTISPYVQTNGEGKKIYFPLSGKNYGNDIINWLAEAGYQHGVASYSMMENVPLVDCSQ